MKYNYPDRAAKIFELTRAPAPEDPNKLYTLGGTVVADRVTENDLVENPKLHAALKKASALHRSLAEVLCSGDLEKRPVFPNPLKAGAFLTAEDVRLTFNKNPLASSLKDKPAEEVPADHVYLHRLGDEKQTGIYVIFGQQQGWSQTLDAREANRAYVAHPVVSIGVGPFVSRKDLEREHPVYFEWRPAVVVGKGQPPRVVLMGGLNWSDSEDPDAAVKSTIPSLLGNEKAKAFIGSCINTILEGSNFQVDLREPYVFGPKETVPQQKRPLAFPLSNGGVLFNVIEAK